MSPSGDPSARVRALLLDGSLALAFSSIFFALWPAGPLLDDAAIVLRYVDNFAAGHPFHYNPGEGPVFGVSGFLHGLLAGMLAWLGVGSRLALAVSNFLGLTATAFAVLRILGHLTPDRRLVLPGWLLVMIGSPFFVVSAPSGLETPLHVAIVLGACLAYLRHAPAAMWVLAALAIVSKLDAVPVVAVLAALRLGELWRDGSPWRGEAKRILLGFLAPLVAWVLFATAVFGNPMPQSAYAKVRYLRASEGWVAFLGPFTEGVRATLLSLGALVALAIALAFLVSRREERRVVGRTAIFGLGAVGVVALYCVMNPVERHLWYYALPEILMLLQIVALVCASGELIPAFRREVWRRAIAGLLLLGLLPAGFLLSRTARTFLDFLDEAETERIAIGRFVARESRPGDVLFTGHGHIAREAGLRTIDHSGLNSPLATDLELDHPRILRTYRPEWVVESGLLSPALQHELGYRLVRSWYNPLLHDGGAAYRLYHREPQGGPRVSLPAALRQGEQGYVVTLPPGCRGLSLGVRLGEVAAEATVSLGDAEPGEIVARRLLPPARRHPARRTDDWRLDLSPGALEVAVTARQGGDVEVLDAVATDCPGSVATLEPG